MKLKTIVMSIVILGCCSTAVFATDDLISNTVSTDETSSIVSDEVTNTVPDTNPSDNTSKDDTDIITDDNTNTTVPDNTIADDNTDKIKEDDSKVDGKTKTEIDTDDKMPDSFNEKDKSAWGDSDMMSMMKDKMPMMDMDEDKDKMSSSMKEMMAKMSSMEMDLKSANMQISSMTSNTTYQGSQNNYLKSLSISGIDFTNEFKKTTSNYFATVSSNVSNITVNVTAEDSSAIVTIYGNTNLQEGKNKIIITVTADDGSVRNYKIYVTKK